MTVKKGRAHTIQFSIFRDTLVGAATTSRGKHFVPCGWMCIAVKVLFLPVFLSNFSSFSPQKIACFFVFVTNCYMSRLPGYPSRCLSQGPHWYPITGKSGMYLVQWATNGMLCSFILLILLYIYFTRYLIESRMSWWDSIWDNMI